MSAGTTHPLPLEPTSEAVVPALLSARLPMPRRLVLGLTVALTALSCVAIALAYRDGSVLAYNDAFAHLKIARFVVAGQQPGIAQLGSGWLPLAHVVMLPFVWHPLLFTTGLAGVIPSAIAFVVAGLFSYALGLHVSRRHVGGVVTFFAFASNPNVLYLQAVPMTESLFLALALGATYGIVRWAGDPEQQRYLASAAVCTLLATLTRYEGWGLAAGGVVLVAYIAWRRLAGSHAMLAHAFTFGLIASYGIGLWFTWNAVIFGDPFYFRAGEYSATAINGALEASLGMASPPTQGQLVASVVDVLRAGDANAGRAFTVLAGVGLLVWLARERLRARHLGVLLLLAPPMLVAASFYSGDTFVLLPERDGRIFNIRYGLVLLPAFAVFAGYLAAAHRLVAAVVVVTLATQSVLLVKAGNVVSYVDATRGLSGGAASPLASTPRGFSSFELSRPVNAWFADHYDYGRILIDSSVNNHAFFSGVPTGAFLYEGVQGEWEAAVASPAEFVDWVFTHDGGTGTLRDRVHSAIETSAGIRQFASVYQSNGVTIYLRRDRVDEWAARHGVQADHVVSAAREERDGAASLQAAGPPAKGAPRGGASGFPARNSPPTYRVVPGDTMFGLAERFRPSTMLPYDFVLWLARLNALDEAAILTVGDSLIMPPQEPRSPLPNHRAVSGDSLLDIARRYRHPEVPLPEYYRALVVLNALDDAAVLAVGRELVLPAAGPRSSDAPQRAAE